MRIFSQACFRAKIGKNYTFGIVWDSDKVCRLVLTVLHLSLAKVSILTFIFEKNTNVCICRSKLCSLTNNKCITKPLDSPNFT